MFPYRLMVHEKFEIEIWPSSSEHINLSFKLVFYAYLYQKTEEKKLNVLSQF